MVEENEEITLDVPDRLGARLKEAREEKKLSITDVAKQLKFMKETIHALENSQWDKLYGRAYARGYLSSYIKMLGMPEKEILGAFDREYISSSADLSLSNVAQIEESRHFPWIKIFTFIFILIISLILYQKKDLLGGFVQGVMKGEYALSSDEETETLVLKEVEEESIIYYEPVKDDDESDVQEQENVDISIPEKTLGSLGVETLEFESASNSAEVESPASEDVAYIQEIETVLESQINLSFSQNCWVEIIDADKNILSNKLAKAGSSLDLKGHSPLTILLGNAAGVTAKINGQEDAFDMSQYTFENITRFNLDGKM